MTSFEKFHPVLTAHLTLDWLTQTPVKSIDDLFSKPAVTTAKAEKMPSQILDTVKEINHIMRRVMNDKELTWELPTPTQTRLWASSACAALKQLPHRDQLNSSLTRITVSIWQKLLKELSDFPRIILNSISFQSRLMMYLHKPQKN